MKDYAKVINQSREMNGPKPVKESLIKSAGQHKHVEQAAPKKSGSGFFSFVALFILIAILFAVYRQYLHHQKKLHPEVEAASQSAPAAASPQFDFYTVLPSGNTPSANAAAAPNTPDTGTAVAPATPAAGTTPPATTATTPSTTPAPAASSAPAAPSGQYYLNAGSFSNIADAQQMLSQLLLLGVQANIKTNQDNGASSYQVLVGPFDDQDAMNIVKQQLVAHQIQASVLQQ